jgi:hypothetical protein
MAGTLTISTLSDGTNSTSATNLTKAPCVAWINYKGTSTQSIRASYNVSSVTVNATGDYTINFTNALADANYSAVGAVSNNGSTGSMIFCPAGNTTAPTTTAFRVQTVTSAAGFDSPYVYAAFFR